MRVGEFATRAGVSARQVRYWDQNGLLPCSRTTGGYRDFAAEDVGRARRIDDMLSAGLTIQQVVTLAGCLDYQRGVCKREREALALKAAEIERKIACMRHTRALILETLETAPILEKLGEE